MIEDVAYFVLMIFAIAIVLVSSYIVVDGMDAAFQNASSIPTEASGEFSTFSNRFPVVFDGAIFTLLIAVAIGVLALVWFLEVNPFLFFAVNFVIVVLAGVAGYLANAWIETMATDAFSAAVTSFPLTNFIFSHYLVFVALLAFLMIIVYYAKPQGGAS